MDGCYFECTGLSSFPLNMLCTVVKKLWFTLVNCFCFIPENLHYSSFMLYAEAIQVILFFHGQLKTAAPVTERVDLGHGGATPAIPGLWRWRQEEQKFMLAWATLDLSQESYFVITDNCHFGDLLPVTSHSSTAHDLYSFAMGLVLLQIALPFNLAVQCGLGVLGSLRACIHFIIVSLNCMFI